MPSTSLTALARLAAPLAAAPLVASCTLPFDLDETQPRVLSIAQQAPLDILFVVDNSGSMAEEQQRLARTVFDERCPIQDLHAVPPPYANPVGSTLTELSEVCGIAQLLAAYGADFHIGVITPDVGICDERVSAVLDPDGLHTPTPMRGCLQGGLITRDDDVAKRFADAMLSVGIYGSPYERPFDAVQIFLDPDSRRAPGCENDLDGFLRKEGRLLVVMVTDEDDCSHDGNSTFPDELVGEPACGEDFTAMVESPLSPSNCYTRADELSPVQQTVDFLVGLKSAGRTSDVYVGAIGGLVDGDNGIVAAGCVLDSAGVVTTTCERTLGTSNGQACQRDSGLPCCTGDAAPRVVELASAVNAESFFGSICADDYRSALLPLFAPQPLVDDATP